MLVTKREVNRDHGASKHGERPLSPAKYDGESPFNLLLLWNVGLECQL